MTASVPHAARALTNEQLEAALDNYHRTAHVHARTPHGTYRFEVVGVERDTRDRPVLVLREIHTADPAGQTP